MRPRHPVARHPVAPNRQKAVQRRAASRPGQDRPQIPQRPANPVRSFRRWSKPQRSLPAKAYAHQHHAGAAVVARPAADWPERWRQKPADPTSALLGRGQRVKVLNGQDARAGQSGVVQRVTVDAGELLVTVAFSDGTTGDYWEHELLRPKADR